MADTLHNSLTNHASDGSLHTLHLPGYSVADVTAMNAITTGSMGDLCFVQSSGSYYAYSGTTWQAMGGGGSSNVTFETAYASPPTATSGDAWYITDSLLNARYTGAAWSYYFGTMKVSKPVAGNFGTWFNQGSATLTDKGDLTLYTPYTAGDNIRGVLATVPSLNYVIDAVFVPDVQSVATNGAYIGWSDGTAAILYGLGNTSGTTSTRIALECIKWTNATTFSAYYAGTIDRAPFDTHGGRPVFLRIAEDSSNRTCYYSFDYGANYIQAFQVGRTDFLTATTVGFFLYSNNSSIGQISMRLLNWAQS